MAKPRPPQAQAEERKVKVADLLLQGFTRAQILRITAQWNLCARQIDYYIAEATKEIKEINQANVEDTIAKLTSNFWKLYRENLILRPSVSRMALKDIAHLNGLDKIEINLNIKREHIDASDEELMAAITGDK